MAEIPSIAKRLAAYEALTSQRTHLVDVIGQVVLLAESLPEGDLRKELYDRISDLDSIADVMGQALDSVK